MARSAFGSPRGACAVALLADLPNVPDLRRPVRVGGKLLDNAVAHVYVPGRPLARHDCVADDFFPRLGRLLAEMHRRNMAYVDLHKRENILVGDDGQPYLIDFQISVALGRRWPADTEVMRGLLTLLQRSDEYHFRKHVAHNRPDLYAEMPLSETVGRPWWIRAHRFIAVPFRSLRRRLLAATARPRRHGNGGVGTLRGGRGAAGGGAEGGGVGPFIRRSGDQATL